MNLNRQSVFALLVLFGVALFSAEAFAPATSFALQPRSSQFTTSTQKAAFVPSSSIDVSVGTWDPTTALSDVLGSFIGSPAILLVPIGAALGVVGLVAWFIVSYANPVVEDDEK